MFKYHTAIMALSILFLGYIGYQFAQMGEMFPAYMCVIAMWIPIVFVITLSDTRRMR